MTQGQEQAASFDQYLAAMGRTPVLGHLALYSIFDGPVTRDDLARWVYELGLDPALLPAEPRPVDAFEKVTANIRHSYLLGERPTGRRRRGKDGDGEGQSATLMVRHVRRDPHTIVRHLVREVRDEHAVRLSYDVKVGECVFHRDTNQGTAPGAGSLHVTPDLAVVADPAEQQEIRAVLETITAEFRRHCTFLGGDRLRATVRRYIESMNAIRVRPTGGVYFVHRQYQPTLTKLRDLVERFGAGSHLYRIPLPDEEEQRAMVIEAFRTKAKEDLERLAEEIADAQRRDDTRQSTLEALHRRFRDLADTAAEHGKLLSVDLQDTEAALGLVRMQLGSLFATAS